MDTFTNFKNGFYSRVKDLSLFDCGDINLLKVVLDGLKVNYVSKGKVRSYLFYPLWIYNLVFRVKGLRNNKNKTASLLAIQAKSALLQNVKKLISDSGRIVYDANRKPKSIYFDNIVDSLKRDNVVIVTDKLTNRNLDHDFDMEQLENAYLYTSLSEKEKQLRGQLIRTFDAIKSSGLFSSSELANIQFAIHRFFHQYKVWSRFLELFENLETCYFVCHYHREGQIYALKQKNIECIELQHGLIAPQDIFYVFPPAVSVVRPKALFADKILTYGRYWKEILLQGAEYLPGQIDILGYYHYDNLAGYYKEAEEIKQIKNGKKAVLITTQTTLHEHFINYTRLLEKQIIESRLNAVVLLKPHPSENPEIYKKAFAGSDIVRVLQYPLTVLFKNADVHVSVFSTTLYDALRHHIRNYVFKVKGCEDYVDEILRSGIATEILPGENPLNNEHYGLSKNIDAGYYYEEWKKEIISR